ncbi:MAG TPA: HEAT repeat domain-containing protein [Candidatus Polarisedimenticolaceae bacterium]|nr:HEAT repeat domain-containing protein [Candidatus Polarisedimenticolaceae bacterium]
MVRALSTILLCLLPVAASGCGAAGRTPASSAPASSEELLTVRAQVLRAEDRRLVDDQLLAALRHAQPEIRAAAVRALGRIGDPGQSSRLEEATQDDAPEVRAAAAFAIGRIGAAGALERLEPLGQDESATVRAATADALGLIATTDAEPAVTRLLADPDPAVAARACLAVPRFARPAFAVRSLIELGRSDRDELIFACNWALSMLSAEPERIGREDRVAARDRMIELTASRYTVLRRMAARGLVRPTREEEAASVGALVDDRDSSVRIEAIRAISFPGAPLEPFLSKILEKGQEEDARVYLEFVDGLGRMRGPDIVQTLADIVVFDPRVWIKERAVVALGQATNYSVKMANGLSRSDHAAVRRATADLLIGRIDDETIEFARRLRDDQDPSVRAAIIPVFAEVDGLLTENLATSVESADPRIRRALALAAGRVLADEQAASAEIDDAFALLERLWRDAGESSDVALGVAVLRATGRARPDDRARALLEAGLESAAWRPRVVAAQLLFSAYGDDRRQSLGPATDHPVEHYVALLRWAAKPRAAIVTVERRGFEPGRFSIALDTANAPLASREFARLAESGAFDGLPISRLVADVALFAGTPAAEAVPDRGFDLREEIGNDIVLAGTLAWGADGLDPLDGNWFISLRPRPELLGRVDGFARVVRNLAGVVALMLPSDLVKSVVIYEGDGSEPLPAAP